MITITKNCTNCEWFLKGCVIENKNLWNGCNKFNATEEHKQEVKEENILKTQGDYEVM